MTFPLSCRNGIARLSLGDDPKSRTSKSLPRITSGKTSQNSAVDYGVADASGEGTLIIVFVSVSVLFVVAGDGFTIVVLLSFFS
jgi:hypothetical protein